MKMYIPTWDQEICERKVVVFMKKFFALILCLMMAFCLTASAEEIIEPIEFLYDGAWVRFEDGFEIYLPADWYEFELTAEQNAQGFFYAAGTEDFSRSCLMAWQPLEADCTIEEAHAALATEYSDAAIVEVNGIGLIACTNAADNQMVIVALDATEPGMYMFIFTPADDEDFQNLAALIAASIREF